jgi:cytochrome c oxidase assembly protein subunit 11
MSETRRRQTSRGEQRKTAAAIGLLAVVMLGASFAAVPIYRIFCAATGYGGTTQTAERSPDARGLRRIAVHFDANVAPGLNWRLTPEIADIVVTPGETKTIFFRAENLTDDPSSGQARFNVTPDQAGAWFDKISCFCFTEQMLKPREKAEWPVVFFLDPKLDSDKTMAAVDAITLSYTMFAPPGGAKAGAVKSGAAEITTRPPG